MSVAEYDHVVDSGVFKGGHVELLEGLIVRMSPHAVVKRLTLNRATDGGPRRPWRSFDWRLRPGARFRRRSVS
jgi:hypothetical protein